MSTQTNKTVSSKAKKVTTHVLLEMKEKGEKIAMLTAYDFSMARLIDQAGIDVILVGDSASNVMAGHETTLPITLDQMIYHAASVIRGIQSSLVVVDLAFWCLSRKQQRGSKFFYTNYERIGSARRENGRW